MLIENRKSKIENAFNLQGHRGARGLKPENTLPSFETAIDLGVSSIETDVHLTADDVPILIHDHLVSERLCGLLPGSDSPDPTMQPRVRDLTLPQLRGYQADRNPDPERFPNQDAGVTSLAAIYAEQQGYDPYTPPTVAALLGFAQEYAGSLGAKAGKSKEQRQHARQVRFDLEIKRVPFDPVRIGDGFDGTRPGLLEEKLVEVIRTAAMVERTIVRCFDHRSIWHIKQLEPRLKTGVLIAGTAPVNPVELVRQANADYYFPSYDSVDPQLIRQLHDAGIPVIPWTVNDPVAWQRLLDWGVDGITTDFPDQLAQVLRERGIAF